MIEQKKWIRSCPSCGKELTYQSEPALKRGNKNSAKCAPCKTILRKKNVIIEINQHNKYQYTAGQIIRYIFSFPSEMREKIALEILNLCNPNIEYKIQGNLSSRAANVFWKCNEHPETLHKTSFRHIVEKRQGCTQCKGQKPTGYWLQDGNLEIFMLALVKKAYEINGCVFSLTNYFNWDSKLLNAWFRHKNKPSESFHQLLSDNNLPEPTFNCYLKDGKIFRGFYEFVGYCLIKNWNVPFQYAPKVFNKYYSDGFFTEIETHWEHWGTLNKNNQKKRQLYFQNQCNLFETFDEDYQHTGLSKFYETLRNFLISKGYEIPQISHIDLLDLIKGEIPKLDNSLDECVKIINNNSWQTNIPETTLRKTKEGKFILGVIIKYFDKSILKFKNYLNLKYGFNYRVTAFRRSYQDSNYFIAQLKPFVEQFKCIPSQKYFESKNRSDITKMASLLCGGLNNLKRNEIEEGEYFYLVKHLYENESAPHDRELVWHGDKNYHNILLKVIKYYKDLGHSFPRTLNTLRHDENFMRFGPTLHSAISRKGGWHVFCFNYKHIWCE